MTPAALAVVAALGASTLTGAASLGVVALQEWLRGRASERDMLAAAVTEMLSRSMEVMMRAQALGLQMRLRSGIGEGVDVTLGLRKPADALEFYEWMARDLAPMNAAWSVIWARGDQETVRLANALLSDCNEVIGASTARQQVDSVGARVRRWAVGEKLTPELERDLNRAVRHVAHARERLAQHVRKQMHLPAVQLFGHEADYGESSSISPAAGELANGTMPPEVSPS